MRAVVALVLLILWVNRHGISSTVRSLRWANKFRRAGRDDGSGYCPHACDDMLLAQGGSDEEHF